VLFIAALLGLFTEELPMLYLVLQKAGVGWRSWGAG